MIGKTIKKIISGEMSGDDDAIILVMEDESMYIFRSGSSYSMGVLDVEEIKAIPKNFKEK